MICLCIHIKCHNIKSAAFPPKKPGKYTGPFFRVIMTIGCHEDIFHLFSSYLPYSRAVITFLSIDRCLRLSPRSSPRLFQRTRPQ